MKKIIITGDFEGSVTVLYGEPGVGAEAWPPLLDVDLRDAVLNDKRKKFIVSRVPVRYGPARWEQDGGEVVMVPWKEQWGPAPLVFTEMDVELDFEEDFWKPYGKKVNKDRCQKEWEKLTVPERAMAVTRLHAYLRYLSRTGIAKADPENYLKKKYFKNDYDNL
jgi:hypothetical protein